MKRLAISLGMGIVLAMAVCGTAVAGPYDFTSGAGTAANWKFDFTAHNNGQGHSDTNCPLSFVGASCSVGQSPVGQMHLTDETSGLSAVADVTCLTAMTTVSGKGATIEGTITRGDSPEFPAGSELIFSVGDNDGANESQSQADTFQPSAGPAGALPCGAFEQFTTSLTSGNIVVMIGTP